VTRVRNVLLAVVVMTAIAAVIIVGKSRVNAEDGVPRDTQGEKSLR
jgi:hypothetical protein